MKPDTDSSNRFFARTGWRAIRHQEMIALATRYDVNAHVASSIVADRLPAMRRRDVDHGGVEHLHEGREHHRDRVRSRG